MISIEDFWKVTLEWQDRYLNEIENIIRKKLPGITVEDMKIYGKRIIQYTGKTSSITKWYFKNELIVELRLLNLMDINNYPLAIVIG